MPNDLKQTGVRIPSELRRRIRVYAALQGKTAREIVSEILDAAIPPLPKPVKVRRVQVREVERDERSG
jgi:hypothetical protein